MSTPATTPPGTLRNGQPYTLPAYSSKASSKFSSPPIRGGYHSTQRSSTISAPKSTRGGFSSMPTNSGPSYSAVTSGVAKPPQSQFVSTDLESQELLAATSLFSPGKNISVKQLDSLVRDDEHGIDALNLRVQSIESDIATPVNGLSDSIKDLKAEVSQLKKAKLSINVEGGQASALEDKLDEIIQDSSWQSQQISVITGVLQ